MAEIAYQYQRIKKGAKKITWSGMANGDDGTWWGDAGANDRNLQIVITAGTGITCAIEGTNEDSPVSATPGFPVRDAGNLPNALALSNTVLTGQALESPKFIRPRVTAGTGANIAVILISEDKK